jgi:hypothetical protein
MIITIIGCTVDNQGNSCNMGAGKDTVANELVHSFGFVNIAMADPFKRFVQDVYKFSDEQIWGPSSGRNKPDQRYLRGMVDEEGLEPIFLTPRYALQSIGSEWGRCCYQDTWVDYLLSTVHRVEEGGWCYDAKRGLFSVTEVEGVFEAKKDFVVSDLRFRNELRRVRQEGGKVVFLIRFVKELPTGVNLNHDSENELKGVSESSIDAYLVNNGSTDDLKHMVHVLHKTLLDKSLDDLPPVLISSSKAFVESIIPETDAIPSSIQLLLRRQADIERGLIHPTSVEEVGSDVPPFLRER